MSGWTIAVRPACTCDGTAKEIVAAPAANIPNARNFESVVMESFTSSAGDAASERRWADGSEAAFTAISRLSGFVDRANV
jgi:hypothetical protein